MIESSRIFLRTVKEADLPALFEALDSIRLKGEYLPSSLLSEMRFRKEYAETGFWDEGKGTALITHPDGTLAGAIWYESSRFGTNLSFYLFRREDRGRGIMSEALPLFCSYLFATQRVERLQIAIPDYSKAALRIAQKSGFQFEGILRSALFHRGRHLDLCLYSLLRGESKGIEKIYT